jgi:hypothetical protein
MPFADVNVILNMEFVTCAQSYLNQSQKLHQGGGGGACQPVNFIKGYFVIK